jgi:hypothetical protein
MLTENIAEEYCSSLNEYGYILSQPVILLQLLSQPDLSQVTGSSQSRMRPKEA